jgi:glutathione peroxidase-family protein
MQPTQNAEPAVAQTSEDAKFDERLFEIPEDETSKFYLERLKAIQENLQKFANQAGRKKYNALIEKYNEARHKIAKKLAFADDVDPEVAFVFFHKYTNRIANKGNVDKLKTLMTLEKAKDNVDQERVRKLQFFILCAMIHKAGGSDKALKTAIEEVESKLEGFVEEGDWDATEVNYVADIISDYNKEEAQAFLERMVESFKASEDEFLHRDAEKLEGMLRFLNLVGNEMVFEGVDDDGEELDWSSYRGKVALVYGWHSQFGSIGEVTTDILTLYDKYHAAGFDVIGYYYDYDLDALENFEKEQRVPWRTVVRELTLEANETMGKNYTDLYEYYGVNTTSVMILVDKDGKVIATSKANVNRVKRLLKMAFPEVGRRITKQALDVPQTSEKAKFDESLFEIPEDETSKFYQERLETIQENLQEFASQADRKEYNALIEKYDVARHKIAKKLAFADDVAPEEAFHFFHEYTNSILNEGNVDELKALMTLEKAKDNVDQERVYLLQFFILCAMIHKAGESGDKALKTAIEEVESELEGLVEEGDWDASDVNYVANIISDYNKEEAKAFLKRMVKSLKASEDEFLHGEAEELEGMLRFLNLVGNEMVVEGVYDDGEELDWSSYRGKVVLLYCWDSQFGSIVEVTTEILALYDKYHTAGFDVIGYYDDLGALENFEKEQQLPWRTVARKLTLEANVTMGKNYADLIKYYSVNTTLILILVDTVGKVIATEIPDFDRVKELLEKIFPDVK